MYYPDRPPRLFWDEEYAKTTPHGGIVAPEEFNPFAWGARETFSVEPPRPALEPDPALVSGWGDGAPLRGTAAGTPPGAQRRRRGGTHPVRMRPGDVITSRPAIVDYSEREGRLGLMLLTTSESRWTNQRDELVRIDRMTLIRY